MLACCHRRGGAVALMRRRGETRTGRKRGVKKETRHGRWTGEKGRGERRTGIRLCTASVEASTLETRRFGRRQRGAPLNVSVLHLEEWVHTVVGQKVSRSKSLAISMAIKNTLFFLFSMAISSTEGFSSSSLTWKLELTRADLFQRVCTWRFQPWRRSPSKHMMKVSSLWWFLLSTSNSNSNSMLRPGFTSLQIYSPLKHDCFRQLFKIQQLFMILFQTIQQLMVKLFQTNQKFNWICSWLWSCCKQSNRCQQVPFS